LQIFTGFSNIKFNKYLFRALKLLYEYRLTKEMIRAILLDASQGYEYA